MSVIYKIINLKTKRVYIGSTTQPERRKSQHFVTLRSDSHHNYKLQADFKKYGEENFSFYVVEDLGVVPQRQLLKKEEEYISKQKSPYNIDLKPFSNPKHGKKKSNAHKKTVRKFRKRKKQVEAKLIKDLPVFPTDKEKIAFHLDQLKELGVKIRVED
jgi:group I intron endonuclease